MSDMDNLKSELADLFDEKDTDPSEIENNGLTGLDVSRSETPLPASKGVFNQDRVSEGTQVKIYEPKKDSELAGKEPDVFSGLDVKLEEDLFDDQTKNDISIGQKLNQRHLERTFYNSLMSKIKEGDENLRKRSEREELLKRIGGYRALLSQGDKIPTHNLDRDIMTTRGAMAKENENLAKKNGYVKTIDEQLTKYKTGKAKILARCDVDNGQYKARRNNFRELTGDLRDLESEIASLEPSQLEYQQKRNLKLELQEKIDSEELELRKLYGQVKQNGRMVKRFNQVICKLEERREILLEDELASERTIKEYRMDIEELNAIKVIVDSGLLSAEHNHGEYSSVRDNTERTGTLIDSVLSSERDKREKLDEKRDLANKDNSYQRSNRNKDFMNMDDLSSLYM